MRKDKNFTPDDFRITEEQYHYQAEPLPEESEEPDNSRIGKKTRSVLLFIASLCVFFASIGMCMVLITKSADVEPMPVITKVNPMGYVVTMDQPEDPFAAGNFIAPESKNDSSLVNILILSVDDKESSMMMLASVDMISRRTALLSIPRDTYVTGNYTEPKLRNVYSSAEESGRGIQALKEKAREMIGFWPDYYMVLDEDSVTQIFELTGDISFEVPTSPSYTDLDSGEQYIDSRSAMQLFSCRNNYSRVETDSTAVQRDLLIQMFAALIQQTETVKENTQLLAESMDTDLTAAQLGYLAVFLRDVAPQSVVSDVLSGTVIETEDGKEYFQVDLEAAANVLNTYFNPLSAELSIYDLNFRQLAGDSGEGEYDEYGFHDHDKDNQQKPTVIIDDDDDDDNEETQPTEDVPPETDPVTPPDPITPIDPVG